MSRLIDADILIEKMLREGDHYTNEDICHGYHNCQHLVYDAPTVDAEPIKHGHWTRTEAYPHRVVCSECYGTYVRNENIIEGRYKGDEIVPIYCTEAEYCPRCGAKMDEVEE